LQDTIGKGALELEGSSKTHGSPLADELIRRAKEEVGFPSDRSFFIPEDVLLRFRCAIEKGELYEKRVDTSTETGTL